MTLPDGLFSPPLAHRGLWSPGQAAENSLAAFEIACRAGYGIELDVRLSADGEAVVFHDVMLERMTGADGLVCDLTAAERGALPLLGGPGGVPTLRQTLDLGAGRAMLLVEIKAGDGEDGGGALEARVAELLRRYEGPCAVISFDAAALGWFARHRRHIPRGLDAAGFADTDLEREPGLDWRLSDLVAEAGADFLVLQLETAAGRLAAQYRAKGLPVVAWTVRSTEDADRVAEHCDNFIFEGFTA